MFGCAPIQARAEEGRRGAFAVVTAEGSAMRRKLWPVCSAAIREFFEDHIGSREAAQIGDTLRRILDAVREESAA